MDQSLSTALLFATRSVVRGRVARLGDDGYLHVTLNPTEATHRCEVLNPAQPTAVLPVGTVVLVLVPDDPGEEMPVVLGQVGALKPAVGAAGPEPASGVSSPDSIVLEAKQTLTLRVGDGSITIREDGKILIKGKDLVSHATRTNRIKGGSVQIN
jgi:hypothetical protein